MFTKKINLPGGLFLFREPGKQEEAACFSKKQSNNNIIKKAFIFLMFALILQSSGQAQLLPGYNPQLYSNIINAAKGTGMPFLLQQGYLTMPGVEIINDTTLSYQGHNYKTRNLYQNPVPNNTNQYYIMASSYGSYLINIFRNVWYLKIPNVLYKQTDSTFYSLVDCVGFGTRVLSAVGDTTDTGNAYLSLIKSVKESNNTSFASKGWVAMAYQFGAAFPTLPDANPLGWSYVSGNIKYDSINAYNHRLNPNLNQYNGRVKGAYNLTQTGDILAFAYGPTAEFNGHFMVISQQPYRLSYDSIHTHYPNVSPANINQFLNTYHVYGTPVYDCSGRNAHLYDSRTFSSGIGHGVLWILTNPENDVPQGFIFKPSSNTATVINKQLLNNEYIWAISVGRYKGSVVGIEEQGNNVLPKIFNLRQNHPNPFNPSTKIKFELPKNNYVTLKIYDAIGSEIASLVNEQLNAGTYEVDWDGSGYASGVYYYSMITSDYVDTKKMILIK